ncbi:MAG: NAD-dependent protein deacylase [Eubacteriales bacterium]|nr:NAD-dependent protein deacylase [Eubacteriales bacterium]
MNNSIEQLANYMHTAKYIVFFGGAGVSTESGIPDFRSQDGLYNTKWKDPPETVLSRTYFNRKPESFFMFYREKIIHENARPNESHKALAKLEEMGKLKAVITQNIDGLHQMAGSKNVLELHGSILKNHCVKCHKFYPLEKISSSKSIPYCDCGGIIKPDVVLYEEALDQEVIEKTIMHVRRADLLIIGGTSLTVYPAAAFVRECKGKIAIINRDTTYMDAYADIVINDKIGETLKHAMEIMDKINHTNPNR